MSKIEYRVYLPIQHPPDEQDPLPSAINTMSLQSIQSIKDQMASIEQTLSQMRLTLEALTAEPSAKTKTKTKKAEPKAEAEPKEPRAPTAWNLLVQSTVADMKQSGWQSWTDTKGVVWPGSRRESDSFVYDGGEYDGKPPSPARGGMVRASYIKSSAAPSASSAAPSAAASGDKPKKAGRPPMTAEQKAEAAAKRAAKAASAEQSADESAAEKPKKAGRPPMTAEQKAAAAAKRAEKKAKASAPQSDAESVHTCSGVPDGWAELLGEKVVTDQKVVENKAVDLSFYPFKYEGKSLIMNDRGDVVDPEEGTWVGRLTKGILDKTFAEPADLEEVVMRE
jgi:hypothetical protein